ncbi:MAG: hypothetical protein HY000_25820 [Planctomycetes bacterium]|nr:hypothetical protein [Planctomycetota bacterium]
MAWFFAANDSLKVTVNGGVIPQRKSISSFTETLTTDIAGDSGELRKTVRVVEVEIYEPASGETAMLYELGIPVVETGDKWHYNVLQKVPLNGDRDNVTPAYLRDLRTFVYNHMHF